MSVIDKKMFKRATALTGACAAKLLLFDPATARAEIAAAGSTAQSHLHREARQVFEEASRAAALLRERVDGAGPPADGVPARP